MGGKVDQPKAQKQWDSLKAAIEKQGVKVLTLDPVKGLPDMVFVCNSGIINDKNVYLSKFRHPERSGEQQHYLEWFKANNYKIFGQEYPEFFEGGGDACFSDYKTLWAGYGARSNKSVSCLCISSSSRFGAPVLHHVKPVLHQNLELINLSNF